MVDRSYPDMASAKAADLERLAKKIERQDVNFLSDGDWLTDADSELICAALRTVGVAQAAPGCGTPGCTDPNCKYGQDECIFERVFKDACDEIGCAYDNEVLLQAIHDLKTSALLLADAQKIIAEYQASTIAGARDDVAAHGLPGVRGRGEPDLDPAEVWENYISEVDPEHRSPQGALAFGFAAALAFTSTKSGGAA